MNNLFNQKDTAGILIRIDQLSSDAQKKWGKMNVSQMLAHCNASLETAMGLTCSKSVGLVGRIFGKLLKLRFFSEKPFPRDSATDPTYIIAGNPDFESAKAKVLHQVKAFSEAGPASCTKHTHAFFGKLTPEEWAVMQWKHFDHHLRQFSA
jgi:hypothetical protein